MASGGEVLGPDGVSDIFPMGNGFYARVAVGTITLASGTYTVRSDWPFNNDGGGGIRTETCTLTVVGQ